MRFNLACFRYCCRIALLLQRYVVVAVAVFIGTILAPERGDATVADIDVAPTTNAVAASLSNAPSATDFETGLKQFIEAATSGFENVKASRVDGATGASTTLYHTTFDLARTTHCELQVADDRATLGSPSVDCTGYDGNDTSAADRSYAALVDSLTNFATANGLTTEETKRKSKRDRTMATRMSAAGVIVRVDYTASARSGHRLVRLCIDAPYAH